MATLREVKAFGATASILLLLGIVPTFNSVDIVALLLGLVLLLVATKNLADRTSDNVYSNMEWAVALVIIGTIVGIVIVFAGFLAILRSLPTVDLAAFVGTIIEGLAAISFFFILAALFVRRSYGSIPETLHPHLFRSAANLFLAGAVLIIVLGIGFILIFAAIAVQLAAFLSLPDETPPRPPTDPWGKPLPPTPSSEPPKRT
jgi:uncharacterized membrane protein